MFILYGISDVFYALLYYVIGYRKKVIYNNLKLAFPSKSENELKKIQKKFFRHFTDLLVESIKAFTISEKEILKRYKYKNVELFKSLEPLNKSILLTGAHYANWEWVICLNKLVNFSPYAAYAKIKNPYFDKKITTTRSKFGANFIKTSLISKTIENNKKINKLSMYGLLSDQSPQLHKTHYWSKFLGVKVPVITGAEMLAKKHDLIVVNFKTTKIKRGYYETEFELITATPKDFEDYEITDMYLKITESHINKQPEFYLWSHKRFKHKDKYNEWKAMKKKA